MRRSVVQIGSFVFPFSLSFLPLFPGAKVRSRKLDEEIPSYVLPDTDTDATHTHADGGWRREERQSRGGEDGLRESRSRRAHQEQEIEENKEKKEHAPSLSLSLCSCESL